MKKLFGASILAASALTLASCGEPTDATPEVLNVYFVPSRDSAEILEATEPLQNLLWNKIKDETDEGELFEGYKEVKITVGSSYEAVGEALGAGTADVGFLPVSTYLEYQDDVTPIVAASRNAVTTYDGEVLPTGNLTKAQEKDLIVKLNNGSATSTHATTMSSTYRSFIVAKTGSTTNAAITNAAAGTLTWDNVKDLQWCPRGVTSSAGSVYPEFWLNETFDKGFTDFTEDIVEQGGYGTAFSSAASGNCDVITIYGDARQHNYGDGKAVSDATTMFGNYKVIGVTHEIANDGIQTGNHMNAEQNTALAEIFIDLISADADDDGVRDNKAIFDIYSHSAYVKADAKTYNSARTIQGMPTV